LHRIEANVLIPGRGDPIDDGCVLLDGTTIAYAGPQADAPPSEGAEVHQVPVVMPGLWDSHVHLFGLKTANLADLLTVQPAAAGARAVKDLEAALNAGFTSVREMGGLGIHLARVVAEGTIQGPTIYAAGAILSPTGGHGDIHAFPVDWVGDYGAHGGCLHLCDGVPECLRGVRCQLRLGAKLIKICASGGVLSEIDHPVHQQYSDGELQAVVQEAARAERIVAAHCHGKPGIEASVRAGVRTIEHGTHLDEPTAALMKESGAILVTTHTIISRVLNDGPRLGVPDYALEKMRAMAALQKRATRAAMAAGVTIALGTDSLCSGPDTLSPWGHHALELGFLVESGMTPLQAIEAGTANGPLTLGPQAPQSGQLLEGYDADVIAVAKNPVYDVAALADADNITKVWRAGELVKGRPTQP
jgi:imidazolonepropionase-like amidohydrolase